MARSPYFGVRRGGVVMGFVLPTGRRLRLAVLTAAALPVVAAGVVLANVPLTQVSSDPFTNTTSQHRTEVEPDTFAFGQTIVSAFQVGRFRDGGASNAGFATSPNGGATWSNGMLPGTTKLAGGTFDRVSDPSVAFDSAHGAWLVTTHALTGTADPIGSGVLANRSTTGGRTWEAARTV